MAAQFFSSLADNALLIAAIALLLESHAPEWMTPMLKLFFVLSYVMLAPFVGAFADSMPKGRVMLITNGIKIIGCLLMLWGAHPLLAYAIVGFGAAAYSPAKYGILTELLPPEKLVVANGWIEGLTVSSIILGTVLGGALIYPATAQMLLGFDLDYIGLGVDTPAEAAILVITSAYLIAAAFNLHIPDTQARYPDQKYHPVSLLIDFAGCCKRLWQDRLGQISLAVTTLFWGAGATLQFIVLKWAEHSLHLELSQGAILQAVVAVGIGVGAVLAASRIPLKNSLSVLPVGIAMGLVVILMAGLTRDHLPAWSLMIAGSALPLHLIIAALLLMLIGGMAGYFVVPMNALLQHRGSILMSAGHSIAVQNFNENLSVLSMLAIYALLVSYNVDVRLVIILFGFFVSAIMCLVIRKHRSNQRVFNDVALIGEPRKVLLP